MSPPLILLRCLLHHSSAISTTFKKFKYFFQNKLLETLHQKLLSQKQTEMPKIAKICFIFTLEFSPNNTFKANSVQTMRNCQLLLTNNTNLPSVLVNPLF